MLPSVVEHNMQIVRTIERSSITLPPLFAVWRKRAPALEDNWSAVLCRATALPEEAGLWRFDLVRGPLQELRCGFVTAAETDEWFGGVAHTILVKRPSTRPEENGKYYNTTIRYNGHYVRRGDGSKVPFVSMSRPCAVLASAYMNVMDQYGEPWRAVLRPGVSFGCPSIAEMRLLADAGAPPLPTAPIVRVEDTEEYKELEAEAIHRIHSNIELSTEVYELQQQLEALKRERARMPQRIVNGFIESVLAGGAVCPISLEPIERGEACLTPCGHVLGFDAAARWIQSAHTCPECRARLEEEDLQRWV